MSEASGDGGTYHNPTYSDYAYAQTLRPPTVNTSYRSNGYYIDRASSHGSTDSDYNTRTPSVASPAPQPSYPIQSYPVENCPFQNYSTQGYSNQSYFPNGQLSQQSPTYPYSDVRSPNTEVIQTAPVSSSKHKRDRRLSPPSPSSPSRYPCLHPHCGHISSRALDLKRHMTVHFPIMEDELLDCKYEWCGRTGAHGFRREDHRKEHYRKLHMKESEPHTSGKGGRSGRRWRERLESSPPPRRRSPTANETYPPILSANRIAPKGHLPLTTKWKSAAKKQVIPSPNTETSELSTTTLAEPGILQPLHGPEARVESERMSPIKVGLDENESFVALMPRPSTEDKLAAIVSQGLKTLVANEVGQYCASLKLQWNILGFMEDQFRENDSPNTALGRVITISGSARHAQATTCSEYIQQTWPVYGPEVLAAVQDTLDSDTHTSASTLNTFFVDGSVSSGNALLRYTILDIDATQGFLSLNIKSGALNIIVDVFQQLTWMGSALQSSRDGGVQYCEPKLETILRDKDTDPALFNVTFDMRSPSEEDRNCWFPLFTNPVIAFGFSTAPRNDSEVGLEIPLAMMAALGGARHVVDFEGGLVMKGHSAMFVPLRRYDQSIQWHLIRRSDEHRILYRELRNECQNRAMREEVDDKALVNTRAFLGWWSSSETHLGTVDAAYDSIDWSPAGDVKRTIKFTGASIGLQTMGTGQLNFALGAKDGTLHFSQKGPFQKIVKFVQKTPVLLYDPTDRRAWCVPGLELMLHVVQTRHHQSPYNIDGEKVELTPVKPENGRGAAMEAVIANQRRLLYSRNHDSERPHYFQDEFLDIWSLMERLMEEKDSFEGSPGLTLHGTMQSKLHGWEYMSLVNERNYKRKEAKVAKSSGGWVDLFNDIDALVLFATGFDDVIKPVSNLGNLCRHWRSLPKGKDYLAVGVPILEMLHSETGSRLSHKYLLTNSHQWHRGSVLFEHCSDTTSSRCECDRTQQIYQESSFKTFGHVKLPGSLEENGCVIFGQACHPFKPPQIKVRSQNTIRSVLKISNRSSRSTTQSSGNEEHSTLPTPPPSDSQESGENGDDATWSRERPPSPVSFKDGVVQETQTVKRCMTPPNQIPNFEKRRRLDSSWDRDDCASNTLENHPMFGHDKFLDGQNSGCTATAGASKAACPSPDGRKTIRHKAKIEDFNHHPSFSLATCSTMDVDSLGSVERVETINRTQRNVK